MSKFTYDKRTLPFGHSSAILDEETLGFLSEYKPDFSKILLDTNITHDYVETYRHWVQKHQSNNLIGFEDFKYGCYSLGTSEAFDKFYIRNQTRRFRCFKSEYLYHQLAWRNAFPDWKYIEDEPLTENDCVVISIPFADTGTTHISHTDVLKTCTELNIPVLIDCAYYSISSNITVDLSYPCITDVVFSLSKLFPVAHARIGIRFTRHDDDDTLFVYDKSNYNNRLGSHLGLSLMKHFSSDYIVHKYHIKQQEFCKVLDIVPSDTILFGIDIDNNYPEYNRGGNTNRLSLHKFLHLDIETLKGVIDGRTIK